MSLIPVATVKYMFLNLMQCKAFELVNVYMNMLYHFDLEWEWVLFLVNRVLRVFVYMVVQTPGIEQ